MALTQIVCALKKYVRIQDSTIKTSILPVLASMLFSVSDHLYVSISFQVFVYHTFYPITKSLILLIAVKTKSALKMTNGATNKKANELETNITTNRFVGNQNITYNYILGF